MKCLTNDTIKELENLTGISYWKWDRYSLHFGLETSYETIHYLPYYMLSVPDEKKVRAFIKLGGIKFE